MCLCVCMHGDTRGQLPLTHFKSLPPRLEEISVSYWPSQSSCHLTSRPTCRCLSSSRIKNTPTFIWVLGLGVKASSTFLTELSPERPIPHSGVRILEMVHWGRIFHIKWVRLVTWFLCKQAEAQIANAAPCAPMSTYWGGGKEGTRRRLKRRKEDWTLMPSHCSGCRLRDTHQDVLRCGEEKAESAGAPCPELKSEAKAWARDKGDRQAQMWRGTDFCKQSLKALRQAEPRDLSEVVWRQWMQILPTVSSRCYEVGLCTKVSVCVLSGNPWTNAKVALQK